jgi:hypothetical protein
MNWYAAHIVMYFKQKGGRQKSFPVWENIVLVRGHDADEALAKAEQRGRDELLGDDGSIRWGGIPAEMKFAGVRKVVLCENRESRPTDGTEVSYTELELGSEKAIRQFVAGESVAVKITDSFREEEPPTETNGARPRKRSKTEMARRRILA